MPFVVKLKQKEEYRLFGSLPILCKVLGLDDKIKKSLSYVFSQKKEKTFENEDFIIIRLKLERGGANSH